MIGKRPKYALRETTEQESAHEQGLDLGEAIDNGSTMSRNEHGEDDDATPIADERPPPSSSSNISSQPSRNGSHYSDARSIIQREASPPGQSRENAMPESYRPTGSPPLPNGNGTKTTDRKNLAHRPKTGDRPKTSDGKKSFGEGSSDYSSTPKLSAFVHSRSQSDLPMTPTKVNGEGFKLP